MKHISELTTEILKACQPEVSKDNFLDALDKEIDRLEGESFIATREIIKNHNKKLDLQQNNTNLE